jgi:hypothetical protein
VHCASLGLAGRLFPAVALLMICSATVHTVDGLLLLLLPIIHGV